MIKVFYGDDRVRAKAEITKFLGTKDYEIIEGADLTPADLPSIFLGNSLFTDTRAILIRDFTANRPVYEKLPEYLNTPHQIAILDAKIDKRSATYKFLKDQIEFQEFTLPKNPNLNLVFGIYRTAKHDGEKAVKMLEKIQAEEDPIMFCGLLISQALKDFNKSTSLQPWLLVQSFLLRLSSL